MIIFDLSCSDNHRFEAWFRSGDDFSDQLEKGLLSCPQCGSAAIHRLPSAVHLSSASPAPVAPARNSASEVPTHPLAVLKAVVDEVIRNAEDVGSNFAEEARKIHYQEAPARSIRGQATADDCSALREEGIDVLQVPQIKAEDLN